MADFSLLSAQRAVFESALSTTEKVVLLALIDHWSSSSPEPWPSTTRLERWTSLRRRAVLRTIGRLEARGIVSVKRTRGGPNAYDLTRVQAALPVSDEHQCTKDTSARKTPDQCTTDTGTGVSGAPPPVSLVHPKGSNRRNPVKEPQKGLPGAPQKRERKRTPEQHTDQQRILEAHVRLVKEATGEHPTKEPSAAWKLLDAVGSADVAVSRIAEAVGRGKFGTTSLAKIASKPNEYIPQNGNRRGDVSAHGPRVMRAGDMVESLIAQAAAERAAGE
jgi:hypothetical protein